MIAAGGTGGHVYPALAVSESIVGQYPDSRLFFVGTVGGFERPLIDRASEQFQFYDEVRAGPIHGVNPIRLASSLVKLLVGIFQAFRVLGRRQPQVILTTGGWVSFPVAVAAWLRRIPTVIYLPDIEPGLTIKTLRHLATKVAITVPESARFFATGQTVCTGYPLRAEVTRANREAGVQHFGLDPERKTLLVFGGSRGARAINIMVGDILGQLLNDGIQVIHVTGTLDWERSQAQVGELAGHALYHPFSYLHDDMGLAFSVADLVVCRAGASILGEFPYFRLPSILIPLAYSWRYQQVNADYLAERGAAVHLGEADAADQLLPLIRDLMSDSDQLDAMSEAVAELGQADGAANVARLLVQLTREKS